MTGPSDGWSTPGAQVHGQQDPSGPRWQRQRRSSWVRLSVLVAVAVVVLGVRFLLAGSTSSGSGKLAAGDCVSHAPQSGIKPVSCRSAGAFGRVVKVVHVPSLFDMESVYGVCPDDTDSVASGVFANTSACVRNLGSSHPGDPGMGGGMLTTGDCINDPGIGPAQEVACAASDAYASVLARVTSAADCPAATVEVVQLSGSDPSPTICLAGDRGVLMAGQCFTESLGLTTQAPCGGRGAQARVVARAGSPASCPLATQRTMPDPLAVPGKGTLCLTRDG